MTTPNLSLIVIVRDQADNLPRCLASVVSAVDDIVVVDTSPHESAANIAREFGARVYPCAWEDDFAGVRNFARKMARGRWILVLDADEVLAPGSLEALAHYAVPWSADEVLPYYCGRIIHFTEPSCSLERAQLDHDKATLFPNHEGFRFEHPNFDQLSFGGPLERAQRRQAPDLIVYDYGQTDPDRRERRLRQSIEITTRALERDPDNDHLRFHLCRELHLLGEHQATLTECYALLNRHYPEPRFSAELLGMAAYYGGFAALYLQRPAEAAQLSLEGIRLCRLHPGLWQTLGGAYLWLQRSHDTLAVPLIEASLNTAQVPPFQNLDMPVPEEAWSALFVIGYAHFVAREYDIALHYFLRGCDYLLHQPMYPVMALITAVKVRHFERALALLEQTRVCYPWEEERLQKLHCWFKELAGAPSGPVDRSEERILLLLDQWQQEWPPTPGVPMLLEHAAPDLRS